MSCCGCFESATGLMPETDNGGDLTETSNILYQEILINSNINYEYTSNLVLNNLNYSSNNYIELSNQIIINSNNNLLLINKDYSSNYVYFNNISTNTRIDSNGILLTYHKANPLIPADIDKFIDVEDTITSNIIETNLLKFDFGVIQTAITSISSLLSSIEAEISALEASDVAQVSSLVVIENQIQSINAILSGLETNYKYVYPLENVNKTIMLNYNTEQFNLINDCNLNIKSITTSIPSNRPSYTNGILNQLDDNNAYIKYFEDGSITFPQNTTIDFLVVGAGGRGGAGFYSGGGGGGEVIYKTSHLISAGTYNIKVGLDSATITDRISKIYQGAMDISKANGGGDGGFYDLIRTSYYNYYVSKVVVARVNNTNNYNLKLGGNKIIFTLSYIEINNVKDRSFPIISITPIYHYKFDGVNFLVNSGSYGGFGDLTNVNNVSIDTINYTRGTSSAYFSDVNNCYLDMPINLNLRQLQVANGFAITFFAKLIQNSNLYNYLFIFDDGISRTNYISFGKYKTGDSDYQLEIKGTTSSYIRFVKNFYDDNWFFFTFNFLNNNTINLYIDNQLIGTLNSQLPNTNLSRGFIGSELIGNISDFRFYNQSLTTTEITELFVGSIIINDLPTSGGSGGGGGGGDISQQSGASAGTPFDVINSKLTSGGNGTIISGGNGGSALVSGGYTEVITGLDMIVGTGGKGNSDENYYPENKNNYGDGGDGYGGIGFQGVVVIKVPYLAPQITFNGYVDYSKINNIPNNQTIDYFNTTELKINDTNVSNIFVASNISSNLHLNFGFINCNITNKQLIPNFYTDSSVGIGIQNPIRNIHIHNTSTNSINGIQITDGNSGDTATDGFSILKLANNDCTIYNNEGANLYLGVGGVEEVRITSTGVGIGGINPVVGLEVSGANSTIRAIDTTTTRVARLELVRGSQTFGNDVYTDWRIENNANNLRFYRQNNVPLSGNALSILNDGKVGIGLDTPNEILETNGIIKIDGGNTNKILFGFDTTNNYRHFISTNHDSSATNLNYIRFGVWRNGQTATTIGDRNCLTLHADYNQFHGATNRYLYINDETANKNSFNHSTAPLSIYHRTPTSTSVLTQQTIINLSREGTSGQSLGCRCSITIGRWENNGTNSRTRVDFNLSHLQYTDDVNVLTLRSDSRIGVNNNNPQVALDVVGSIKSSAGITGTAGSLTSLNMNNGAITSAGNITGTGASFTSLNMNNGAITSAGNITTSGITLSSSGGISSVGTLGATTINTTTLNATNIVPSSSIKGQCIANFHNGNPSAVPSGYMATGSLTIGDTNNNYGAGSGWSSSTAGLLMECLDNTEIIVHDAGHRLTSLLCYQGGGSLNNIYIGRDCGWGIPNYLIINSTLQLFDEWYISKGQPSAINTINSLIFSHIKTGFNSKWWFNGTQTATSSEISDERVKKEIKEIENPLEKLMKIKPKEYYLCQDKDYNKKFGVIAQDINQEEELKHLIYKDEEFIANIYSTGVIIDDFKIKVDINISSTINIDDELKILLDNNENQEFIIDDTPFNNRYKKRYVKVKSIIDDYTFEIYNKFEIEDNDKNKLFIYGKKTNDFLKLDYESLYSLNIKATQELIKEVKSLKEEIRLLKLNIN